MSTDRAFFPAHRQAAPKGMAYLKQHATEILCELKSQNLLRSLSPSPIFYPHPSSTPCPPPSIKSWITWCEEQAYLAAKQLLKASTIPMPLNFNTNDYLGLQRSAVTMATDSKLISMLPLGGLSARLVGGQHEIYEALERTFAKDLGFESALYMPSGSSANHALADTLASLQGPDTQPALHCFSDRLNHASIIHGLRRARLHKRLIYPHLNFHALHSLITTHDPTCALIWSESTYSMDGDGPDIKDLTPLFKNESCVLVLDEAHSLGITGAQGKGITKDLPSHHIPSTISVYPCGKALGANGAMICGPKVLIQLLINTAPDFIYTTAPSPVMAASILTRYLTLQHLRPLRERLQHLSTYLAHEISNLGFEVTGKGSALLAVIVESSEHALQMSQYLRKHSGIITTPIRYPTVPKNSPRIRLSLHPFLQHSHCQILIQALQKSTCALSPPPAKQQHRQSLSPRTS